MAIVGIADGPMHGDVTGAGLELHRAHLVELDLADAGPVAAFAETTPAVQGRDPGVASQVRARRQVDLHVDRFAAPAEGVLPPPSPWCLDQQPAVGVLDAGLLGGGHVVLLGRVARAYLDDGVGAVACDDC